MSNTRVFNYQEITSIYNQMNQIIGDSSDPSTIAGLLHKIDEDYHEVVNGPAGEDELALRGDLGMQLLNNWENTAGSFPAFVENFSSWSTLVAQTAGDYSAFEEQVRGIRAANPLGWNTGGIQNGYVASSSYTNSFTDAELDEAAAAVQMYDLVGAYYVDTGMVAYAKKAAFWNGFGDVLSVVSIVASGCSLVKGLGIIGGAAKTASTGVTGGQMLLESGDETLGAGGRLLLEGSDETLGAGGRLLLEGSDETLGAGGRMLLEGSDEVMGAAGQNIDDLVAQASKMNTKDKVAFIEKLRADGTISNSEDFLKFFGGKESVAKTAYTAYNGGHGGGGAVRDILKGFDTKTVAGEVVGSSTNNALTTTGGKIVTQYGDEFGSSLGGNASQYGDEFVEIIDDATPEVIDTFDVINADGSFNSSFVNGSYSPGRTFLNKSAEFFDGAGTAVKNGLSAAGTGLKNAGTWVYQNGVPVMDGAVSNLGTTGFVGQISNVGQNKVNDAQLARSAEMVARANEHFGNNN